IFRLVRPGERVCVLVGHGNNGRDGAVAAEWLLQHGTPCDLVLAPRHAVLPEEIARLCGRGASVTPHDDAAAVLSRATVVVDALVGIGAKGVLREPLASMARRLNE